MPKSEKLKEADQRAFIKAYWKYKKVGKAYKSLHPDVDDDSANVLGSRMLKEVNFDELLEEAGLSDAILIGDIKQGRKATKLYGKEGIEHPDFKARHSFVETALRLKKRLIDRVALGTGETGEEPITLVVSKAPETEVTKQP